MCELNRKTQCTITHEEKLVKLIEKEEARIATLEPKDYKRHQDYLRVLSQYSNNLLRYKNELYILELKTGK